MSDWGFLHDMYNDGYSEEQIANASACGYNPWEWSILDDIELPKSDLKSSPQLKVIFENLVVSAMSYYELTGRYLQIWGELGELFAEIEFGIRRHKPHTQGSDGKIGNDFIEIKTISPEKTGEHIKVKRSGNFNKLLIVKISEEFKFEARLIGRNKLSKGKGKNAKFTWKNTAE